MNTATDNLETSTPESDGGVVLGQSTTDKIGFYGFVPQVQISNAAQATVSCSSGVGTASATSGLAALTSGFTSTQIGNALATLAAQGNAMRAALVSLGLIKGS